MSKILSALPNLLILNGQATKDEVISVKEIDITDDQVEELSLNNEIDNFNAVLDSISLLPNYTKYFKGNFMEKLKEEIDILNSNCNISNYLFCVNVLKAKFSMYHFLHDQLIDLCDPKQVDKGTIEGMFLILKDIRNKIEKCQNDLVNLILNLSPKIEQQIVFYRKEYNDMKLELQSVKESLREKEKMNKVLYENNKILQAKINANQINSANPNTNVKVDPNKGSFDLGHTKGENKFRGGYSGYKKENEKTNDIHNNSRQKIESTNAPNNGNIYLSNLNLHQSNYISPPKIPNTNKGDLSPSHYGHKKNKSSSSINTAAISPRNLTQKQLIQVITEIYASKAQYDKKCYEYRLPKETLEQHMYTFLNNKYGLKNLTIEWATSIINGIKQFSLVNSEVCLFGKILRNELEEESYQVYQKLKATIYDLLNYYYQTKFPYKSTKEIDKMLKEKQNSYLSEEEWKTLIKYLFPKDSESVLSKINEYIEVNRKESDLSTIENKNFSYTNTNSRKLTREEIKHLSKKENDLKILYSDFNKILLEIQIRLRDKYLSNFLSIFKSLDEDDDGILNEEQFRNLIIKLDVYPLENIGDEYDKLISKIDPFNTQVITFSDCITVLSNEYLDDKKTKVLDKIALRTVSD